MGSEKVIITHNNSHYEESIVCHRGGTVVVPDGVFYTGPITLKSNVNLHLSDNATLRFLTDVAGKTVDYKTGNAYTSAYGGSFDPKVHYVRPLPQTFLDNITKDGKLLTTEEKAAMQNPGY